MAEENSITSSLAAFLKRPAAWKWGGIGCRVSFYMVLALFLVALLIGVFFFWEGKKTLDAEIRGRAIYVARELAAMTADDIITGNRLALSKKLSPPFAADEEATSGSALLYVMIYNHQCNLLVGSTANEVFFDRDSYYSAFPGENSMIRSDAKFRCDQTQTDEPTFVLSENSVYDLMLPVMGGKDRIGYVRVGISGQRYEEKFSGIIKKSVIALFGIFLVGLAFSRFIVLGITRPILQLSDAAEKLSQQNWDTALPVKGVDEISKLGHTFNQMAQTLKQREASLSRGNRDLFILHTTGLDLMESLDRDALMVKVAARAEDLVRADTTAVSVVDSTTKTLTYLGVHGSRATMLRERDLPVEAGGIYNWLATYGTPLLIPDTSEDFRLDAAQMHAEGIRSIITVPLWSSNTMIGLLTAINKKGGAGFNKHDLRLFTVFSNLVSAALQNVLLYGDLKGKMEELRTAQEQLVRSTKMAAIGELSANIAHEINNPLTSVLGYTTHLLKTLDIPEQSRKILRMMEQETLRVRKIIRNLLDFARQRQSWMLPEDVSVPLRETVALIQGIAEASSITIREEYSPGTFPVNMDHNEMKQVFINIANNALQAMPSGGELRIRLHAKSDRHVVVEFIDNGVGIATDHMNRIFEPFFSTKDDGDGTGLGLSISYRIIQNHGGRIEAHSMEGRGTAFRVYLPLCQEHDAVRGANPTR